MTIGQMFVELGLDVSAWGKALALAEADLDGLSQTLVRVGGMMTVAFTALIGGVGVAALQARSDFESAMNEVSAKGEIYGRQLAELSEQAKQLGLNTIFSATQAAEAMAKFAESGFKANEIAAAMPGTLALAATEHMELGDAARLTGAILHSFGKEADYASTLADILAQTSAASATTVVSLGHSFQYIGPVAAAANQNILDIAAALGVMANAGIRGESAGTGLRNLFSDLLNPSREAAQAIADLGIKVFDANGKLLPLKEIIKELQPLTSNMEQGFDLFGRRFSDVLPLLKAGGADFERMRGEISNFEGAAKRMTETMRRGIKGDIEEFKSAVETALLTLGEIIEPVALKVINFGQSVVKWIGEALVWFQKLPQPVQDITIAFVGFLAVIGPLTIALGGLISVFSSLATNNAMVTLLSAAVTKLGAAFTLAGGAITSFSGGLQAANLGGLLSTIKEPLVSLGTAVISAFTNIPGLVGSAKTALADLGPTIMSLVSGGFGALKSAVVSFGDEALLLASGLRTGLVSAFSTAGTAITSLVMTIGTQGLTGALASAGSALLGFLAPLAPLGVGIGVVVAAIAALAGIAYVLYDNWNEIKNVFVALWTDLSNIVIGVCKAIGEWIEKTFGSTVVGYLKAVWNGVVDFFKAVWDGLTSLFSNGLKWIVEGALAAAKALNLTETTKALQDWLDKLNGIKKASDEATSSIDKKKAATKELTGGVKDLGGALGHTTGQLGDHKKGVDAVAAAYQKLGLKNYEKEANDLRKAIDDLKKSGDWNKLSVEQQEAATRKYEEAAFNAKGITVDLSSQYVTMAQRSLDWKREQNALNLELDNFQAVAQSAVTEVKNLSNTPFIDEMMAQKTAAAAAAGQVVILKDAYKTLGLTSPAELKKIADAYSQAAKDIANDPNASQFVKDNALLKALKAQADQMKANGITMPEDMRILMADLEAKVGTGTGKLKDGFANFSKEVSTIITNFSQDIAKSLFEGDTSWGEKGMKMLKDLGSAFVASFIQPATEALVKFVDGVLSDLLSGKGLGGILDRIKDIGGAIADIFTKTPTPPVPTTPGGTPPIPGGGAGAAVAGGLWGAIGAVGAIGTMVSSIIGNFQMAKMEGTLNAIEESTRYSMIMFAHAFDQLFWPFFPRLGEISLFTKTLADEFREAVVNHLEPLHYDTAKLTAITAEYILPVLSSIDTRLEGLAVIGESLFKATSDMGFVGAGGNVFNIYAESSDARSLANEIIQILEEEGVLP